MAIEATSISSPCGHTFNLELPGSEGVATTDCPECKALIMLVWTPDSVTASLFHKWMHARDPRWPADGAGTGYVEF